MKSDAMTGLFVLGGLVTLGFAAYALSDKARYTTAEHRKIVDDAVAAALDLRTRLGRPLSGPEISNFMSDLAARTREPFNGADFKRIYNAARG